MNKPHIVSISAIAGGGKTFVTKALTDNLNKAVAFYFDDYESSSRFAASLIRACETLFSIQSTKRRTKALSQSALAPLYV